MGTLSIRLTRSQEQRLRDESEALGMTRGSLIKKEYFGREYSPRRVPRPDQQQLAMILAQLGKIGSNINQVAHHLNSGRVSTSADLVESVQSVNVDLQKIGQLIKNALQIKG